MDHFLSFDVVKNSLSSSKNQETFLSSFFQSELIDDSFQCYVDSLDDRDNYSTVLSQSRSSFDLSFSSIPPADPTKSNSSWFAAKKQSIESEKCDSNATSNESDPFNTDDIKLEFFSPNQNEKQIFDQTENTKILNEEIISSSSCFDAASTGSWSIFLEKNKSSFCSSIQNDFRQSSSKNLNEISPSSHHSNQIKILNMNVAKKKGLFSRKSAVTSNNNNNINHELENESKLHVSSPSSSSHHVNELNEDRFNGDGVMFQGKLIGHEYVAEARGEQMCQQSLKKLKIIQKALGGHKKKINMFISFDGIKIYDFNSNEQLFHHSVPQISFISRDETDTRAFGYVFGNSQTGHQFIGIKTKKEAMIVMSTIGQLFAITLKRKRNADEVAAASSSSAASSLAENKINEDEHLYHSVLEESSTLNSSTIGKQKIRIRSVENSNLNGPIPTLPPPIEQHPNRHHRQQQLAFQRNRFSTGTKDFDHSKLTLNSDSLLNELNNSQTQVNNTQTTKNSHDWANFDDDNSQQQKSAISSSHHGDSTLNTVSSISDTFSLGLDSTARQSTLRDSATLVAGTSGHNQQQARQALANMNCSSTTISSSNFDGIDPFSDAFGGEDLFSSASTTADISSKVFSSGLVNNLQSQISKTSNTKINSECGSGSVPALSASLGTLSSERSGSSFVSTADLSSSQTSADKYAVLSDINLISSSIFDSINESGNITVKQNTAINQQQHSRIGKQEFTSNNNASNKFRDSNKSNNQSSFTNLMAGSSGTNLLSYGANGVVVLPPVNSSVYSSAAAPLIVATNQTNESKDYSANYTTSSPEHYPPPQSRWCVKPLDDCRQNTPPDYHPYRGMVKPMIPPLAEFDSMSNLSSRSSNASNNQTIQPKIESEFPLFEDLDPLSKNKPTSANSFRSYDLNRISPMPSSKNPMGSASSLHSSNSSLFSSRNCSASNSFHHQQPSLQASSTSTIKQSSIDIPLNLKSSSIISAPIHSNKPMIFHGSISDSQSSLAPLSVSMSESLSPILNNNTSNEEKSPLSVNCTTDNSTEIISKSIGSITAIAGFSDQANKSSLSYIELDNYNQKDCFNKIDNLEEKFNETLNIEKSEQNDKKEKNSNQNFSETSSISLIANTNTSNHDSDRVETPLLKHFSQVDSDVVLGDSSKNYLEKVLENSTLVSSSNNFTESKPTIDVVQPRQSINNTVSTTIPPVIPPRQTTKVNNSRQIITSTPPSLPPPLQHHFDGNRMPLSHYSHHGSSIPPSMSTPYYSAPYYPHQFFAPFSMEAYSDGRRYWTSAYPEPWHVSQEPPIYGRPEYPPPHPMHYLHSIPTPHVYDIYGFHNKRQFHGPYPENPYGFINNSPANESWNSNEPYYSASGHGPASNHGSRQRQHHSLLFSKSDSASSTPPLIGEGSSASVNSFYTCLQITPPLPNPQRRISSESSVSPLEPRVLVTRANSSASMPETLKTCAKNSAIPNYFPPSPLSYDSRNSVHSSLIHANTNYQFVLNENQKDVDSDKRNFQDAVTDQEHPSSPQGLSNFNENMEKMIMKYKHTETGQPQVVFDQYNQANSSHYSPLMQPNSCTLKCSGNPNSNLNVNNIHQHNSISSNSSASSGYSTLSCVTTSTTTMTFSTLSLSPSPANMAAALNPVQKFDDWHAVNREQRQQQLNTKNQKYFFDHNEDDDFRNMPFDRTSSAFDTVKRISSSSVQMTDQSLHYDNRKEIKTEVNNKNSDEKILFAQTDRNNQQQGTNICLESNIFQQLNEVDPFEDEFFKSSS